MCVGKGASHHGRYGCTANPGGPGLQESAIVKIKCIFDELRKLETFWLPLILKILVHVVAVAGLLRLLAC